MNKIEFKDVALSLDASENKPQKIFFDDGNEIEVYPKSLNQKEDDLFFIGRKGGIKYLFILSDDGNSSSEKFSCIIENSFLKRCELTTENRKALQLIFDFTNPKVIGLVNSFGFGDRIGLANAGHLRSLDISDFKPILTQQSIRELTRTNRTPDDVMDAAIWAVFQEDYKAGFGADADHLKTKEDIDLMMEAGYKMFTFDPSDFVENNADNFGEDELKEMLSKYPWEELNDSLAKAEDRYLKNEIDISGNLRLNPENIDLLRAYVKYGKALAHIQKLNHHIKTKYPEKDYEVEVSVDETESVTTPFEHFFISNELKRLEVSFVSLAPRFVGDFEKGIDYKGDLDLFKKEYEKHLAITKYFGNYKISLHSGSDKFSVYEIIGSMKGAFTHVKTAGTSYLEALKVCAIEEPALFREILDYSRGLYEEEKRTYHVSADVEKVRPVNEYKDSELEKLFDSNDARQILHVTFGRILTDEDENGKYIFKNRIVDCLKRNEETHYKILIKHFHKHLKPFN